MAALPAWTTLALWRSNVVFGESDAYLGLDLSHFVSWLPVETAAYDWAVTLFALTAVLVVALYALTPSLAWGKTGVRVSTYARRHITVLGALVLLLAAWEFRLNAFRLLVDGSGDGGLFTRIDHAWIVPADFTLSLLSVGAAVVLLVAGWMGQTMTSFVAVSAVIIGSVATHLVGPLVAARIAADPARAADELPYRETRNAYTRRAFPVEPAPPSHRFAADSVLLANAGRVEVRGTMADYFFPGALGTAIVLDPSHTLVAPRLGDGFARLMHAWAEQNPRLLQGDIPANAAFATDRDVKTRVEAIAPIFAQSREIGAIPTARGVLWIVDLYSTSETYPLSTGRTLGSARLTYSHHAATAYVVGGTGATLVVPDSSLDPIARAWFDAHRGRYVAYALPPDFVTPPPAPAPAAAPPAQATSGAFRADVTRIYQSMRAALDAHDLRAFGFAFDSLGIVIQRDK